MRAMGLWGFVGQSRNGRGILEQSFRPKPVPKLLEECRQYFVPPEYHVYSMPKVQEPKKLAAIELQYALQSARTVVLRPNGECVRAFRQVNSASLNLAIAK